MSQHEKPPRSLRQEVGYKRPETQCMSFLLGKNCSTCSGHFFLSGFPKAKIKSSFKGDLLGGLVNLPRFVYQHLGCLMGVKILSLNTPAPLSLRVPNPPKSWEVHRNGESCPRLTVFTLRSRGFLLVIASFSSVSNHVSTILDSGFLYPIICNSRCWMHLKSTYSTQP